MDRQITQIEGRKNEQFNETIAASKKTQQNNVKVTCLLKCKFLLQSKQKDRIEINTGKSENKS